MTRHAHWLRENREGRQPVRCVWVDCETEPVPLARGVVESRLRFGWACFSQRRTPGHWTAPRWRRFTTAASFWQWCKPLARKGTKLYVFAHNAAFDLTVLKVWANTTDAGWELKHGVVEGPPTILEVRRGDRTMCFLDTLNWFKVPLRKLGDELGLPKLDMPADWTDEQRGDTYCRRDVEIIRAAMLAWWEFLRRGDLGNFAPTVAAQAFAAYRHRFMRTPIFIDDNDKALELARAAYLGGRVECFHLGRVKGPLYQYDVNSMYPHVMRSSVYPTRLLGFYRRVAPRELARWLDTRAVVARVELATDERCYPLVMAGRLVFPVGRFTAALAGPELAYAVGRGHVVRTLEAAVYERGVLFTEYVDWFYAERLKAKAAGQGTWAFMCKLMLNSLYGKFGQRGRVYQDAGAAEDGLPGSWSHLDTTTGRIHRMRKFGGRLQELTSEGESRHSHPAIAAYVTSYARAYLWGLIRRAGERNVLYVDTDSLLVNGAGHRNLVELVDAQELGKVKLEGVFHRAELRGLKDYTLGDKVRIKGVRKDARKVGPATWVQDQFVGWRGMIREGDLEHQRIKRVRKTLSRVYSKGRKAPSGAVEPFKLSGG